MIENGLKKTKKKQGKLLMEQEERVTESVG